jgi:transposase
VECAWSAVRTSGRLRARYYRLVLRFGGYRNPAAKKRAIVAIAHTLAVIVWHVLADGTTDADLGPDFYARRTDPAREAQRLIARLEALGHTVTSHRRMTEHPAPPGPAAPLPKASLVLDE